MKTIPAFSKDLWIRSDDVDGHAQILCAVLNRLDGRQSDAGGIGKLSLANVEQTARSSDLAWVDHQRKRSRASA